MTLRPAVTFGEAKYSVDSSTTATLACVSAFSISVAHWRPGRMRESSHQSVRPSASSAAFTRSRQSASL
jgi:hypothetical protein